MIIINDECCDCSAPGFPCIGAGCFLKHVKCYYCDECEREVEVLYWLNDRQLCDECVLNELEVVE